MSINCQYNTLKNLLVDQNPDIVTATESWLNKEHYKNEIFPANLGYTVFRRDKLKGKGGGVFILVKTNLLPSEQANLNTNCEIIWIKIEIKGSKPLFLASFYKPHELDTDSILELGKSLDLARNLKGTKLILGDFNLPKLNWDSDHTPHLKVGLNTGPVYDKFLDIIDDHNLVQMVNEGTRNENILDLLTSNYTLVNNVKIIPGISDHDIISTEISSRHTLLEQKPRINLHFVYKGELD